jgi:hypothetical protein
VCICTGIYIYIYMPNEAGAGGVKKSLDEKRAFKRRVQSCSCAPTARCMNNSISSLAYHVDAS